ncbi:MAG: methionine adenosyltransferase [Oscillospiraceae bacterium]|nr:methionine adenosyltransferase [Oscillospiraceae bacterium]
MKTLFTSESVTCGHPDKVCDQIADAILDAILKEDPAAHVACEVTACRDLVHIMGEVTAACAPDYESIARGVIRDVGYTRPRQGFDADSCRVRLDLHEQSPDIARGVCRSIPEDAGAGDQGMMFGYACLETECLMPLPITLANALTRRLELARREKLVPGLLPDGKAQVTVEYQDGAPLRISAVVLSTQHEAQVETEALRGQVLEHVIKPALPASLPDKDTLYYINPTGRFVLGGPAADSGLTGRKIISDTYGSTARHGGGSFSGKDPTKVDRTGAYLARYLAKNIVAAGLASRCEVQLAYAIGLADPISVRVDTFGTGLVSEERLADWLTGNVDMRPAMVIRQFGLRRPIYRQLSCYGHFGEHAADMPWERTMLAEPLAALLPADRNTAHAQIQIGTAESVRT